MIRILVIKMSRSLKMAVIAHVQPSLRDHFFGQLALEKSGQLGNDHQRIGNDWQNKGNDDPGKNDNTCLLIPKRLNDTGSDGVSIQTIVKRPISQNNYINSSIFT